ncbi:MAG: hypothetical protein ACOCRO_07355 [Halanaerobiales bacterium]
MKFTLKLQDHKSEYATIKKIMLIKTNDEGKIISRSEVGYIGEKYADMLEFTEKHD